MSAERAVAILGERLGQDGAAIVAVRARDPRMVACVIVGADPAAVRLCGELGLEMRKGGHGVVGLLGEDAARLLPRLDMAQRQWLLRPCGLRETKVLLVAGGLGLLSVETRDGAVTITHAG